MRAGAYTVQQTLTTEAASVLKHSLSLARRRGHAQVTPLHVAVTLLSSRASLLRRACLKSQPHQTSHPLQCRALELCFNVALNRLPTTPAGPLLHAQPSLSNALIAALKRAQAHQRRGCIEQQQQQQPLLAIKVELEQLILSILDDPSVSRVMREAGFSSTAVKNNLDDSSASSVFQCYSSSGGVYSSPSSPSPTETPREFVNSSSFWRTHFLSYTSEPNSLLFSPQKKLSSNPITDSASQREDIKLVLEVLLRKKRRNTVIVGDSVSITEGLVAELTGRVERKEVPEELKSARFIKFQFSSAVPLRFMKREEVELNLSDLKRKVDSLASGGGVIIYTGDLKWTVDSAASEREVVSSNGDVSGYNPVDHLVAEIGRLLSDYSSSSAKVWLMATANYQTYMKCQMKQPPLEIQWGLQAVSVPSGGLGLSLHATSVHDSRITFSHNSSQVLETKPFTSKEEQDKLTCCAECTSNYEREAKLFKSGQQEPSLYLSYLNTKDLDKGPAQLPCWLQSHSTEARQKEDLVELRRKWNRLCQNLHQGRHTQNQLKSSSFNNQSLIGSYPCWPNQSNIFGDESSSISFADSTLKPHHSATSLPRFRRQQSCHIEFSFSNGKHKHQPAEPNLDSLKNTEGKEVKITLALGNSLSSDNGKHGEICKVLQENVPWQSKVIPSIVEALIDCKEIRKKSCLLIEGNDSAGKRRLARAVAESVFGSADLLLYMNMRDRDNRTSPCSEILERALRNHEKLVILVEDVDFADTQFIKFLADDFETGKLGEFNKKEGSSGQIIFILTKSNPTSYEDDKKNPNSVIQMKLQVNETIPNLGTSKFDHKRKAEWDLSNKTKSPRIDEKEDACVENGNGKKEFTRQLSSNTLDLNIKADEEDESRGGKRGEFSSISSDLTRGTSNDLQNPLGFLELFKNRFIFNRNSAQEGQMKEMILSRIRGSFEDACGGENTGCLIVEEMVLEKVCVGAGCFVNSLFDKWLKDVFQTSLRTVKIGGKENMSVDVRLCFEREGESGLEDGFMGSNLPKKIHLSFVEHEKNDKNILL
ncbi:hypothetical protein F0562_009116 [Nyssa sinensis]|uniref:Clp R domain-containing protein n=1 Tax=Nyssa sinensis TaxID=561372 RepID=A0A5J4ZZ81_9ASTE|nr:hypothetical protein F0562_009116 [Nyssa sinensis]